MMPGASVKGGRPFQDHRRVVEGIIYNRKRRGAKGGRPPSFDAEAYKRRNVIERCFESFKQWRGIATRYDKLAIT